MLTSLHLLFFVAHVICGSFYISVTEQTKFHKKNTTERDFHSKIKSHTPYCGHDIDPRYQTYWQTSTGYTYCDSCAKLLQFAEGIRKFVLEYENDEVVEMLWPWYRNTFHVASTSKYGKYINKYNLSHLYMEYDLLPDFGQKHQEDRIEYDDDDGGSSCWCGCGGRSNGVKSYRKEDITKQRRGCFSRFCCGDGDGDTKKEKRKVPHIRHRRKFAGQMLLGGWDTLRNLNIIRQQLLPVLNKLVTPEIVEEEVQDHHGQVSHFMTRNSLLFFCKMLTEMLRKCLTSWFLVS